VEKRKVREGKLRENQGATSVLNEAADVHKSVVVVGIKSTNAPHLPPPHPLTISAALRVSKSIFKVVYVGLRLHAQLVPLLYPSCLLRGSAQINHSSPALITRRHVSQQTH